MEQSHFEIMEQLGQISIFDLEIAAPVQETMPEAPIVQLELGDKVKCNVTEQEDAELYWYLFYYHPDVLKGAVLEVTELLSNDNLTARYKSEIIYLKQQFVSL